MRELTLAGLARPTKEDVISADFQTISKRPNRLLAELARTTLVSPTPRARLSPKLTRPKATPPCKSSTPAISPPIIPGAPSKSNASPTPPSGLHYTDAPYVWHVNDGPEVFVVLDGEVDMRTRRDGAEASHRLTIGMVFHAEAGDEHVAHPVGTARVLVVERTGSV